jgi:hypothetical protein
VCGKLNNERYTKLSSEYEAEQKILVVNIATLEKELSANEERVVNIDRFIKTVKQHTKIVELTSALVNEMIEKIVIHAPDKSSGKRVQQIDIYFSFGVGVLDFTELCELQETQRKSA